jgi:type IV pilus assembly protein PilB
MKDMGVPTFLITATVEAILAQRLVRRVCAQCREETTPSEDLVIDLGMKLDDFRKKKIYKGRGCEVCNNTGYKGRVGLFELLIMNDKMRDMVMENCAVDELRDAATGFGMVTLRQAAMNFAFEGMTTLDEVVRETILEA